jgi:hypothetical protein
MNFVEEAFERKLKAYRKDHAVNVVREVKKRTFAKSKSEKAREKHERHLTRLRRQEAKRERNRLRRKKLALKGRK